MLSIEIDGHFHGSSDVPKPWVARIAGIDGKFGLRREFLQSLNDWESARVACSGNLYGVVANFALREGNLYEMSRCRGKSSKRYAVREFWLVGIGGKLTELEPLEALAHVESHGDPVVVLRLSDGRDAQAPQVSEVARLGRPTRLGFVLLSERRNYRLREGRLYEVIESDDRRLLAVVDGALKKMTDEEALEWLARKR